MQRLWATRGARRWLAWLNPFARRPSKGGSAPPSVAAPNGRSMVLVVSSGQNDTSLSLLSVGGGLTEEKSRCRVSELGETNLLAVVKNSVLEACRRNPLVDWSDGRAHARVSLLPEELFCEVHHEDTLTITLPYLKCVDGQYRNIDIELSSAGLRSALTPGIEGLIRKIASFVGAGQGLKGIAIVGGLRTHAYLHREIVGRIEAVVGKVPIRFLSGQDLAKGCLRYTKVLEGREKRVLALQSLPYGVHLQLRSGAHLTLIEEGTIIPFWSKEHELELGSSSGADHAHLNLLIREGSRAGSVEPWKIKRPSSGTVKLIVKVEADTTLGLQVRDEQGMDLHPERCATYVLCGGEGDIEIRGQGLRQFIKNQFSFLEAASKRRYTEVFEPSETFYSFLAKGEAFTALRYLGRVVRPTRLPDVQVEAREILEGRGVGGYFDGKKIVLPSDYPCDPHGAGYVLAHEFAHHLLLHEEGIVLEDEQENEIMTEIYVVYRGMGKLLLNGFRITSGARTKSQSRGYLSEEVVRAIHEIYFERSGVDERKYLENVSLGGREVLVSAKERGGAGQARIPVEDDAPL